MKKEWLPAALLTLVCLVLVNGLYTAMVWGMAQITPQKGLAERIVAPNGQRYYANIAQKFTDDKYFWPRPSAVDYNAAGSGGSNKGPANPDFLKTVSDRKDSFLAHNPSVLKTDVPAELVTASGSGLDPDISVTAANAQVVRVAKIRGLSAAKVQALIAGQTQHVAAGLGPDKINVLRLNIRLDELSKH